MSSKNKESGTGKSATAAAPTSSSKQVAPFQHLNERGKPTYGTNDTTELLETIPTQVVDSKLDEVLHAVKTLDTTCDFSKCKTKTTLMGQDCDFCKKKFCFKHGLPEVHGCGDAIKKDERKKFMAPKPLKTVRHEQELGKAKGRLESKLKEMQISRTQKQPGGSSTGGRKKKK